MSRAPLRVPAEDLAPGERALPTEPSQYVARVHRRGAGDRLVLFDPDRAIEADAEIVDVDKRKVVVRVLATREATRPARSITLIQGVGKGDKMDAIVRDATELGATAIAPALCERSVARPDGSRAARWRRIAVEAARQCGRADAPIVAAPAPFQEAIQARDGALRICLDPRADHALGDALSALDGSTAVALVVGPEGGLSPAEMEAAVAAGFSRVRFGAWVLRTETVCAAVLGAILASSR
jgi:16S rRNA (uracil1498-N3)-methyltransferase